MMSHGETVLILKSFAIIPKIGGCLSLLASYLVVRDISIRWNDRKRLPVPLMSRILFWKCISNMVFSFFGAFLSTWMAPRDQQVVYALGNLTTCEVQGFLVTFANVHFVSSFVSLMVVYWLKNRYGVTEVNVQVQGNVSRLAIGLPIAVAFAIASPPLFYGLYNFSGLYTCTIAPFPLGCGSDLVQCQRGDNALNIVFWLCITLNVMVATVTCICPSLNEKEYERNHGMCEHRLVVSFVLGCLATVLFVSTYGMVPSKLLILYMSVILTPLTGCFVALIYFYPRYSQYRRRHRKSKMECIRQLLNGGGGACDCERFNDDTVELSKPILDEIDDTDEEDFL
eukprot:g11466.t1 g11466   contig5:929038-930138(+)